jgi:hypothetical protein
VLSELESQNEDQAGEMSKKVKMLKDVSRPTTIFAKSGYFRREGGGYERKERMIMLTRRYAIVDNGDRR